MLTLIINRYANRQSRRFQFTRPGDWACPNCSVNNFASRTACFKCETEKPEGAGLSAGEIIEDVREGDWYGASEYRGANDKDRGANDKDRGANDKDRGANEEDRSYEQ